MWLLVYQCWSGILQTLVISQNLNVTKFKISYLCETVNGRSLSLFQINIQKNWLYEIVLFIRLFANNLVILKWVQTGSPVYITWDVTQHRRSMTLNAELVRNYNFWVFLLLLLLFSFSSNEIMKLFSHFESRRDGCFRCWITVRVNYL